MASEVKLLIVGVGSIGERHVRTFQATGRVRVSICEVDQNLGRRVARQYGIDEVYADLDAALEGRPDAAVIATPAHLHVPMACTLASAGTHLLIEKPLSTNLGGIDRLAKILKKKQLVAAVAYVHRAQPSLAAMRQAIRENRFGRPAEMVVVAGQHFPTYRPAYRDIYYRDRAAGGGAIQDALTHLINAGEWLLGPIHRIVADAAHQVLDGVAVEDTVHVCARHGDALASYSLNQYQAPNETTMTVVCQQGTARFEMHRQRWAWIAKPDGPWHEESCGELSRDELFVGQANAFLDAVAGQTSPLCDLQEGLQTLRCNLAILESVEQGAWTDIGRFQEPTLSDSGRHER